MMLLNMDASLIALERKYQLLQLEEYMFLAYENEPLYNEKGNDAKVVVKFIQYLFTSFDARHSVIRSGYSISECFQRSSKLIRTANRVIVAYHPHASGQEELINDDLKRIFEQQSNQSLKHKSIKLDESLRAYQTALKTPIGSSHCRLVYDKACHLYAPLENKALWAMIQREGTIIQRER